MTKLHFTFDKTKKSQSLKNKLLKRYVRTSKENKISLGVVTTEAHEAVDLTNDEFKNYFR